MAMIEWIGVTLNGWVAALGGVAVVWLRVHPCAHITSFMCVGCCGRFIRR